jgi:transcriptional/translational regulatory protein YebC/TACO1
MVPQNTVAPSESEARQILRMIDQLEDNDDVQDVYANFDISEEVLEAVAG